MIAASEELHDEKLEFTSLIQHLNEVLKPRGIELKRIKWDPEKDGPIDAYMGKLHDCEMCLNLFWRELADNSEEELNSAYQQLKDGKNPRNLYVFFKEPTEDLTEALRVFKANFVNNYGHFFCKFENVDTMNLHFILQFEAYQNRIEDEKNKLIQFKNGKVCIGGEIFVNFDNIPFAAMNSRYRKLRYDISEKENRLADIREKYKANPDNEELEDELILVKQQHKKMTDEFESLQQSLFNMALTFVKNSHEFYSERMTRARVLFEKGDYIAADEILNIDELEREDQEDALLYNQMYRNRELKIEEFLIKADMVMLNSNLSISERIDIACRAYENALSISRQIKNEDHKIANILFLCAECVRGELISSEREEKAEKYYCEALAIYKRVVNDAPTIYYPKIVQIQRCIAHLYYIVGRFKDSKKILKDSIDILQRLTKRNADVYTQELAKGYYLLADLYEYYNHFKMAERYYLESLKTYNSLLNNDQAFDLISLADTQWLFASMLMNIERYEDAIKYYLDSIDIYQRSNIKEEYCLSSISEAYQHTAYMQRILSRYDASEDTYQKALGMYERLIRESRIDSDYYIEDYVWTYYNYALLKKEQHQYKIAYKMLSHSLSQFLKLEKRSPEMYSELIIEAKDNLKELEKVIQSIDYDSCFK